MLACNLKQGQRSFGQTRWGKRVMYDIKSTVCVNYDQNKPKSSGSWCVIWYSINATSVYRREAIVTCPEKMCAYICSYIQLLSASKCLLLLKYLSTCTPCVTVYIRYLRKNLKNVGSVLLILKIALLNQALRGVLSRLWHYGLTTHEQVNKVHPRTGHEDPEGE